MSAEDQLKQLIEKELDNCCSNTLPRVKSKIKEQAGREMVAAMAFNLCKNEGISVQTALSEIDSEL